MTGNTEYTVNQFYVAKKNDFKLTLLTDDSTLNRIIPTPYLNRPGLALAGFFDRFSDDRIQILGETEVCYLGSLDRKLLYERLQEFLTYNLPCIILTKGLSAPPHLIDLANEYAIPVLSTQLNTNQFYKILMKFLDQAFARHSEIHGVLVEVLGIGMLITGASGIGKSECALDLVDRGHRMVCDDHVKMRSLDGKLIGSPSMDDMYSMEIRGIGIVDIEKMYGIHGIRKSKEIDIAVELVKWDDSESYQRLGLDMETITYLGITIPIIYLPVTPGKNLSVIMEVIAMNYSLRTFGYNSAEAFLKKTSMKIMAESQAKKDLEMQFDSKKD